MKKCAVTPGKDAVIPSFDPISAHIPMNTVSLEKLLLDEVVAIFYALLEVNRGILHYQLRRRVHW